jgi:Transcriptional regulator, AbiEi antitoxin, Type IV TA system
VLVAENRLVRILAVALDGTAAIRATPHSEGPTLVVQTAAGDPIALRAVWAGEGWPDDVRRAAASVPDPWPSDVVLMARRLSPGAIEWLRARSANWADEDARARIAGPGGLLVVREPPARAPDRDRTRHLSWSPSSLSIAEFVLARPDERLSAAPLARDGGWSTAQAASVLGMFDAQGWTVKRGPARGPGAYREILGADGMLSAWSVALGSQTRDTRIAHRAARDVMGLLSGDLRAALDDGLRWAVSGWAGLELTAPFTTTVPSVHVYIADEDFAGPLTAAITAAGLRELDEGGRVIFWRADPRILNLANRHEGVPVVSAPRLYADLVSFDARGQDAADHVKSLLIDPLHPTAMAEQPIVQAAAPA